MQPGSFSRRALLKLLVGYVHPRACRFYPSIARNICESVTNEVLEGKSWSGEEETVWTVQIADQVKARVKQEMTIPRYKIVVQVTLGEMRNQGIRVASKCLWDADSDNYASYSFQNVSLVVAL